MNNSLPLWKWFGALLVLGVLGLLNLAFLWQMSRSDQMDGFILFLGIFLGLFGLATARYLYRNFSKSTAPKTSLWILGFYGLFGLNMVVEIFILPRFGWDNTPKNDWYFQLWWVLILLWTFLGRRFIQRKIQF